jgi:hypothetical protein
LLVVLLILLLLFFLLIIFFLSFLIVILLTLNLLTGGYLVRGLRFGLGLPGALGGLVVHLLDEHI